MSLQLYQPKEEERDSEEMVAEMKSKLLELLVDQTSLNVDGDLFLISHTTIKSHFDFMVTPEYLSSDGNRWYYVSGLDDDKIELLINQDCTHFTVIKDV
jgi:hypothetical protein